MIKFFRTIRQKLINEGNVKRYMFYAFGEIALVVIGILIALQINNWNEERKDYKEEYKLLTGLKKQFESLNQGLFNRAEMYDSLEIHTSRVLYPSGSIDILSNKTLINGLKGIKFAGTFDTGKGVLEALVESGRLELIQNDRLRDKLSGWSSVLEETKDNEISMRNFINLEIIPVISSKLGTNIGRITNQDYISSYFDSQLSMSDTQNIIDLLKDTKFVGLATWRHVWLGGSKIEFYWAAEYSREVLELIKMEIEQNKYASD